MHSFESDYTAGARVEILRRLNETNLEQLPGYGSDKYCESAKEKIRAACDCPGADIFFMVGGTQTNAVVIDSMLPSYGGVMATSATTRPAPSNSRATRSSPCPSTMASSAPRMSGCI